MFFFLLGAIWHLGWGHFAGQTKAASTASNVSGVWFHCFIPKSDRIGKEHLENIFLLECFSLWVQLFVFKPCVKFIISPCRSVFFRLIDHRHLFTSGQGANPLWRHGWKMGFQESMFADVNSSFDVMSFHQMIYLQLIFDNTKIGLVIFLWQTSWGNLWSDCCGTSRIAVENTSWNWMHYQPFEVCPRDEWK